MEVIKHTNGYSFFVIQLINLIKFYELQKFIDLPRIAPKIFYSIHLGLDKILFNGKFFFIRIKVDTVLKLLLNPLNKLFLFFLR